MTRLSGYIGLIFFIISFYLAARIPILNWMFHGLQRQLRWHHSIALVCVAAILCHVSQLIWNYQNHLDLLFKWNDIALLSGWITLTGIFIAIPFAFWRVQISYRRWRAIHLVTVICLITALAHTLLVLEPDEPMEWIIFLLLVGLGTMALFLSVVLPEFPFYGKKYLINCILEVRPKLFLLQLQPNVNKKLAQHFNFEAGQFLYLKFCSHKFSSIWHPFTIVSRPSADYIELFVKARGRDTERLTGISLPFPVRILAPFGKPFWELNQSQLWIAYGVGAAIFLAAIRSFPISTHKRIHFICCDSSANKMFFSDELDDYAQRYPHFTWESYIGSGQEFIDQLRHNPIDSNGYEKVRICGHPKFQNKLKSILIARGIQGRNIQLEGLL